MAPNIRQYPLTLWLAPHTCQPPRAVRILRAVPMAPNIHQYSLAQWSVPHTCQPPRAVRILRVAPMAPDVHRYPLALSSAPHTCRPPRVARILRVAPMVPNAKPNTRKTSWIKPSSFYMQILGYRTPSPVCPLSILTRVCLIVSGYPCPSMDLENIFQELRRLDNLQQKHGEFFVDPSPNYPNRLSVIKVKR